MAGNVRSTSTPAGRCAQLPVIRWRRGGQSNCPPSELSFGSRRPPCNCWLRPSRQLSDFLAVRRVMFRSALKSLASRGRLVEIAATGEPEVSFDFVDFYHNESRL